MHIFLTPELERIVQDHVDSGLYSDTSEVLREAVRCLHRREQAESDMWLRMDGARPWTPETLRAAVAVGAEEAERGEFVSETMDDIIAELEQHYPKTL